MILVFTIWQDQKKIIFLKMQNEALLRFALINKY